MSDRPSDIAFPTFNRAYNTTFTPGRLSIGLSVPLASYYMDEIPPMQRHIERVQLAETLGFSAVWLRDVPFNVPAFGDVGQMFDPFVYLGALAASTHTIALGVASVILPLRHPAHVAKSAASVDVLSNGRLLLGVASGDRPEEYPALKADYEGRGARFRDSMAYIRSTHDDFPMFDGAQGTLNGHIDMMPKPTAGAVPMLITGGSQQSPEWAAVHGDGWITYPRKAEMQAQIVADYRARVLDAGQGNKPVVQSLYLDVSDNPNAPTRPLSLGFSASVPFLIEYLKEIEALGINHVAINLRYNNANIEDTMRRIAAEILPAFTA